MNPLAILENAIVGCRLCPRLVAYREHVATVKRKAYREWSYWGLPVPGFGDRNAHLLIVGLAPGAHGANRTGRVFTGDSSGDLLYRVLYKSGFASQPRSESREDGLRLSDAFISAAVRCAPPGNRPSIEEERNCRPYLEQEIGLLNRVKVVVALGRIAFGAYLRVAAEKAGAGRPSEFAFAHGAEHQLGAGLPVLLASYHPSRQNTSTGRLTEAMFQAIFDRARSLIDSLQLPSNFGPGLKIAANHPQSEGGRQ